MILDFVESEKESSMYDGSYVDDGVDKWVVLGVHRETWRFDRLAAIYRLILNNAYHNNMYSEIKETLLSLHDRKGNLTVTWKDKKPSKEMMDCVDNTWKEYEGSDPNHYFSTTPYITPNYTLKYHELKDHPECLRPVRQVITEESEKAAKEALRKYLKEREERILKHYGNLD